MGLGDWANIATIVVFFIIIVGIIISFARGGFSILSKVNKIEQIERNVNALLILHIPELIAFYKEKVKITISNPSTRSYPDKDELLDKLQGGNLIPPEANRLTQILSEEEAEAKRKNNQLAVLIIGALLLLIILTSKGD